MIEAPVVEAPKAKAKKAAKKAKSNTGHRDNVLYEKTSKLNLEKLKGQAAQVAKAVLGYGTPKDLATIADKVKSNGEYDVKGGASAITDSVHYHLRRMVSTGEVKESKVE
jgi:hypothetical protein